MGADHRLVHGGVASEVLLDTGWVLALEVTHDGDDIGLVDGAGPSDEVAEVRDRMLHEAGEAVGAVGRLPAPRAVSHRGVVKWWKVTTGRIPCP